MLSSSIWPLQHSEHHFILLRSNVRISPHTMVFCSSEYHPVASISSIKPVAFLLMRRLPRMPISKSMVGAFVSLVLMHSFATSWPRVDRKTSLTLQPFAASLDNRRSHHPVL